jgi:Flp pilus assembly protein TadG
MKKRSLSSVHRHSAPAHRAARASRARGQALIEFALTFPFLVMVFFLAWMGWLVFQQEMVYLNSSSTLAEEIARQGDYTPAMHLAIADQLNTTNGVSAASTYLYIIATKPDSTTLSCGTPPGTSSSGGQVPITDGWSACAGVLTPGALPAGTQVEVDVWGYQDFEVPLIPMGALTTPTGHAVAYVLKGS